MEEHEFSLVGKAGSNVMESRTPILSRFASSLCALVRNFVENLIFTQTGSGAPLKLGLQRYHAMLIILFYKRNNANRMGS